MINPRDLLDFLKYQGIDFFTGVPDSLLQAFCSCLLNNTVLGENHFIAPNEGLAVSLASGHFLATGNIPLVYLQNSGIGNIINPVASLTCKEIYGIPILYIIGWRGKPGQKDEPQHYKQGQITQDLLELVGIKSFVIEKNNSMSDLTRLFNDNFQEIIASKRSIALIIEKGTFSDYTVAKLENNSKIGREQAVRFILETLSDNDIVVSTTGKISREVYDYREFNNQNHYRDFLTVGSMGHASMIALGIAISKPNQNVYCLDGDGAAIMHMGSLALIGSTKARNYIHIVLNNSAYESVGGQPTIANHLNFREIARSCGYKATFTIKNFEDLDNLINNLRNITGPIFVDLHVSIGSRNDLSRPSISPFENRLNFMNFLEAKKNQ